jgi:D-alanyl-D-alanine carboxypeptidase/D-alanyl-D-alanine-endopeptidase (penicillin-binding protein 4)
VCLKQFLGLTPLPRLRHPSLAPNGPLTCGWTGRPDGQERFAASAGVALYWPMAQRRVLAIHFALLFLIPLTPAGAADLHQDLSRLLEMPCLKKGEVGLRVAEVDTGKVLFDAGGEKPLIPASNVKLVLAAAALSTLGPTYSYATEILSDGPLSAAGILRGNLYLKGYGDPVLVSEQLWLLARGLKHLGISEIRKDLIADDSTMAQDPLLYEMNPEETSRAYTAKPGGLSLNFNTVQVMVEPAKRRGDSPRVQLDPDSNHLTIDNKATTEPSGTGSPLRIRILASDHREVLQVRGSVSLGAGRVSLYRSVDEPALYTARVFAKFLAEAGISLRGGVRRGTAPPEARLLYTHRSKPLSLIIQDMNKWSNNFIAEQLLRTLGKELHGSPGTREKGLRVLQDYLAAIGISADSYQLQDGSGLSRENRLSAAELVFVLRAMAHDSPWQAEFMASLGLLGMDGVVERRFSASPARGLLRVKTGTLQGVAALSGYAGPTEGRVLAFSLLWNGSSCSSGDVDEVQARLATILAGNR